MKIRLGYVAIALNLPKVTTSSTVTFTNYNKIQGEENKLNKLKKVGLSNLEDLHTILEYNIENNIHFYRITSTLIPLSTHPEVEFNYRNIFKKDFEKVGKLINSTNMRVDTHPNEFNVINSIRPEVVHNTIRNLWPHVHLFEDLNYPKGKMVIHVGSSQGGKDIALKRFKDNITSKIPQEISNKLIIENDDKTFNILEVLNLCKDLSLPMVLDVHHHNCNNSGENLKDFIEDIFNTWNNESLPPKIHFSSPRDYDNDRKHADFIDAESFIEFLDMCKVIDRDFDIMLESKKKDLALYKLVEDIKKLRPNWVWEDSSTLVI